jgi:beta-lactamase superfamily II metal-dependent hydrolase
VYNGFEVDLLSLGNADCILVTHWQGTSATRVLIDGGNKGDALIVRRFLEQRGITYIHAMVCTHPHDDHAGGLLELVEDPTLTFGRAYLHIPQWHLDMPKVIKAIAETKGIRESMTIEKSLGTTKDLCSALHNRGVAVAEPFAGTEIEFLTVAGPSLEYYEELVAEFQDADRIRTVSKNQDAWDLQNELIKAGLLASSLLDNPETTPENDSSVILATSYDGAKYLFTADAGAPALQNAANRYSLRDLRWMQIPHHGSRHNITVGLIDHFKPRSAWVSAKGSMRHPRRSVVNAFKARGVKVYSTHYPTEGSLHRSEGTVPTWRGFVSATPLWDAA